MFHKILFATDGTPVSARACDQVRDLAKLANTEVVVLNVYRPLPLPGLDELPAELLDQAVAIRDAVLHDKELPADPFDQAKAKMAAASQEIVDNSVKALSEAGVKATGHIMEGSPVDAIVKLTQDTNCDLIVIGSRGLDELSRAQSSVSFKVVTHSSVPVLIVH